MCSGRAPRAILHRARGGYHHSRYRSCVQYADVGQEGSLPGSRFNQLLFQAQMVCVTARPCAAPLRRAGPKPKTPTADVKGQLRGLAAGPRIWWLQSGTTRVNSFYSSVAMSRSHRCLWKLHTISEKRDRALGLWTFRLPEDNQDTTIHIHRGPQASTPGCGAPTLTMILRDEEQKPAHRESVLGPHARCE